VIEIERMISANVIKGVHDLLEEQGVAADPGDTLGNRVAKALGISARQSQVLLQSLHDGASLEEAVVAAEIDPAAVKRDFLVRLSETIGRALGRIAKL
jgi:hypothetical protein